MRPPKKLGRCCDGDGWVSEREGLEGVVGLAGDEGCAGVEYEREPRLPPPPARAHTLAASVSSNETSAAPIRVRRPRDIIGPHLQPHSTLRERLRGVPRVRTSTPSSACLWFTEGAANQIGRIDATTFQVTEFPIHTAGSRPNQITAGPDGALWFTESNADQIGRIIPSGQVTEFSTPTPRSGPFRITAGPDGNVWFTENAADQIGRFGLPPE
jgi:hypothetical protein